MARPGIIAAWTGVLVDGAGVPLPGVSTAVQRLVARGVVVVAIDHQHGSGSLTDVLGPLRPPPGQGQRFTFPRPDLLLVAARDYDLDLATSWLIGTTVAQAQAAAQAGCAGCVLLGSPAPSEDLGIVIAEARDFADAPRVMIPRSGGCWHGTT